MTNRDQDNRPRMSMSRGVGESREFPFSLVRGTYQVGDLENYMAQLKTDIEAAFSLGVSDLQFRAHSLELELRIFGLDEPFVSRGKSQGLLHSPQLTKEAEIEDHVLFIFERLDSFISKARSVSSSRIECSIAGTLSLFTSVASEPVPLDGEIARHVLRTMGTDDEKIVGIAVDPDGNLDFLLQTTYMERKNIH